VVRKQRRVLLAERLGDDLALLVPERHSRLFRKIRTVLEEHGGVHVSNRQLLSEFR
jgi:hypothetical protein